MSDSQQMAERQRDDAYKRSNRMRKPEMASPFEELLSDGLGLPHCGCGERMVECSRAYARGGKHSTNNIVVRIAIT